LQLKNVTVKGKNVTARGKNVTVKYAKKRLRTPYLSQTDSGVLKNIFRMNIQYINELNSVFG